MRNKMLTNRREGKKEHYFDYSLLFDVLFLLIFGIIMIYSSSSYVAERDYGSSVYFLKKQLFAVGIGLVAMFITSMLDYHIFRVFSKPIFLVSHLCLILLPFFGIESHGAKRWLSIMGISFQPAEACKLAIILVVADLICKFGKKIDTKKGNLIIYGISIVSFLMIYRLSRNLSSALIILGISFFMMLAVTKRSKIYMMLMAIGSAVLAVAVVIICNYNVESSFRFKRIQAWINPELYADSTSYQTLQALYAIGSGNFWGKGLGSSMQKLGFIPEAQNDMIFSIICEELGIFGAIYVMILFMILIWRCMFIAINAKDKYGSLLAIGVMGHLAIQVILNIAVVTKTIPNTGISLPFISYGGSSVMFLLIEIGMVLNVSRNIELKTEEGYEPEHAEGEKI